MIKYTNSNGYMDIDMEATRKVTAKVQAKYGKDYCLLPTTVLLHLVAVAARHKTAIHNKHEWAKTTKKLDGLFDFVGMCALRALKDNGFTLKEIRAVTDTLLDNAPPWGPEQGGTGD